MRDETSAASGMDFSFDSPPKLLKPSAFTINVHVKDHSAGDPVEVEFMMPAMAMPKNVVKASPSSGSYKGTAMLTMSGKWLATVTVKTKTAGIIDQTFPFDVP